MDSHLKKILDTLPPVSERVDSTVEQLRDLTEVARTLGMQEAALVLERLLASTWYCQPKPIHPEQQPGEIHLCNLEPDGARVVGWKTKRIGVVAYSVSGQPDVAKVPIFVQAHEFKASGQWDARYTIKE